MGVITLPVALGAAIYLCLGKGEGKTVNLVFYAFAAAGKHFGLEEQATMSSLL